MIVMVSVAPAGARRDWACAGSGEHREHHNEPKAHDRLSYVCLISVMCSTCGNKQRYDGERFAIHFAGRCGETATITTADARRNHYVWVRWALNWRNFTLTCARTGINPKPPCETTD